MNLTTITRSKPFYVVAGAADAAVKTLREAPEKISTLRVERTDVEKAVATLQAEAVALPRKAQTTAVGLAGEVIGRTDAAYADLLGRGRAVVGRVRRQKATEDLKKEAATTVRRTRATATSARESVEQTRATAKRAAKRTTTTAKTGAATTRRTAKGAAASAAKTAQAAGRAAADGADKVGS